MTAAPDLDESLAKFIGQALIAVDIAQNFASRIVGRELGAAGAWHEATDIEASLTAAARELRNAAAHHRAITTQEKPHADRT